MTDLDFQHPATSSSSELSTTMRLMSPRRKQETDKPGSPNQKVLVAAMKNSKQKTVDMNIYFPTTNKAIKRGLLFRKHRKKHNAEKGILSAAEQ